MSDITIGLLDKRVIIHVGNDAGIASYSLPFIVRVVWSTPLRTVQSTIAIAVVATAMKSIKFDFNIAGFRCGHR